MKIGYFLSSEEWGPRDLVELATKAEQETPCGPDVERHVHALQECVDAGFDELYVQQIGPEQDAFFDSYRDHVLPRFG